MTLLSLAGVLMFAVVLAAPVVYFWRRKKVGGRISRGDYLEMLNLVLGAILFVFVGYALFFR